MGLPWLKLGLPFPCLVRHVEALSLKRIHGFSPLRGILEF